jgi:hypothetical protein
MEGVCWQPTAPCPPFADLALLHLSYVDFDGQDADGELVVAASVAAPITEVFRRLHEIRFPIARMRTIEHYGGDDDRSMADNNCSGFNFRTIAGSSTLSRHAVGLAIDINPVQNPYLLGSKVLPPAAAAYLDRADVRPGMIVRPGPVVDAFTAMGWEWGGDWTTRKDYHHFCSPT